MELPVLGETPTHCLTLLRAVFQCWTLFSHTLRMTNFNIFFLLHNHPGIYLPNKSLFSDMLDFFFSPDERKVKFKFALACYE